LAEVVEEDFEARKSALRAIVLLDCRDSAKFETRLASGFGGCHAALDIFVGEEVEVRGEFVIELGVGIAKAESAKGAIPKATKISHDCSCS
jgi:hypothetical protein